MDIWQRTAVPGRHRKGEFVMEKQKWGLVLAGGGGKGAYQIGVWKALREFGLEEEIAAVSGVSVGALNAVLFGLGSLDQAEDIWKHIDPMIVALP